MDDNSFASQLMAGFQSVFGISLPLITHLIPQRCKVTTVVGEPIKVQQQDDPSAADVDELLTTYVTALRALFEKHHSDLAKQSDKLTIQ